LKFRLALPTRKYEDVSDSYYAVISFGVPNEEGWVTKCSAAQKRLGKH